MSPDVLNDKQVAELLGMSSPHAYQWIQKEARAGRLRGRKVGRFWRFHRDAVMDYLLLKGGRP